jgi:hypothetical protein
MFVDIVATSASVIGAVAFSTAALAVISGYHGLLLSRVRAIRQR